jgi:hypothetical protein
VQKLFNLGRLLKVQRCTFNIKKKILPAANFVLFTGLSCLEYQLTSCKVKYYGECRDGMMKGETEVSGKG